ADALSGTSDAMVIAGGIGRTNAAAATTQAILEHGPFDFVCSIGIAGMLPDADLSLGETIVAEACVYAEEGLQTNEAFMDMAAMGFALGDFPGNQVPVDQRLLQRASAHVSAGPIATVATCSGSDQQARLVARRTNAIAEAMEGAAVVHAARRLDVPAIEVRAISNTTGDRDRQQWDIAAALTALGDQLPDIVAALHAD
ncbi:MAG: futalosine hydrolase, partial [Phycisphaerales bacterium]|nr:futalosine hydrolase [Phycisphaerales bacterium]